MTRLRHVDDVAAGNRDERRDAGALGAQRLLGDLDQDFLVPAQHLLDGTGGLALGLLAVLALGALGVGVGVVVGPGQQGGRRLGEIGGVVPGVEEGVLAEADVHERGLHAGQDVRHRALVHAAHDGPVTVPLEIDLGEEVTLLDGDPGFEQTDVDDDALAHGSIPPTPGPRRRRDADRPGVSLELPHSNRE